MSEDRIQQLEDLIEADPGDADLPFMLGRALIGAGRHVEACAPLERAAASNPDLAAIRREWGRALAAAGDRAGARRVWEEGIALSERTGDLQAGKEMRVFLKRLGPAEDKSGKST